MKMFSYKYLAIGISFLMISFTVKAQIRLPKIIGSNMVLQREKPLPIWGWASVGEKITVQFLNQERSAIANDSGYWRVELSPVKASFTPEKMTIKGNSSITLTNILIGEVWLCSGQSNMEYPMKRFAGYTKPFKGVDSAALELLTTNENIRLFNVEKVLSLPDVTSNGWNISDSNSMKNFSAAGYYFAKNIQNEINVPIGIIASSWGGSRIEPWTPASGYEALPAFAKEAAMPSFKIDGEIPGRYYNKMILPLAPFALRGFLWYQGESNCMINDGMRYADKMQALVDSWRKQWGSNNLSFYSVLIAPYNYVARKDKLPHTPETLAEFWEAQVQSLKMPHTALIVTTDLVDQLSNIHPSYKWEVGRRLSLLALAKDYGEKNLVLSGPVYKKMQLKKNKVILSFTNADGLQANDGKPLSWFTIAGSDGKFVEATAEIKGSKVVVSSPLVLQPTVVRFAWNESAQPNFFNAAGLPAVPFRTDGLEWDYHK
ncbi:MAG: sialate O-acetylesterase [Pedobacter sp.]|nr:sialate O-acetylesterase [Chitinophagaceae bacterium]